MCLYLAIEYYVLCILNIIFLSQESDALTMFQLNVIHVRVSNLLTL